MGKVATRARFVREFLREPSSIGAVTPSSRELARAIVEDIPWSRVRVVLELGPGTGALTGEILRCLEPRSRFLAIERNPAIARIFRARFPGVPLHVGSVSEVREVCRREGIGGVDVVLSGLPWASFPARVQDDLLAATCDVLRPGAWFVTFAYLQGLLLPAGRRFRGVLRRRFAEIRRSRVVWRNLPPAFVYRCRMGSRAAPPR